MILKRFNIVRIILFLFPAFVFSQERCWVYFTDKKESVSIYKPNDFLTQESIDRRHSQEIAIIENASISEKPARSIGQALYVRWCGI